MRSSKITFTGHSGAELAARLDLPEGPVRAAALFAHCFTCSKDIAGARRIAGRLAALGIAVLRFDFTGLGHSEGEFANTGFSSNVADIVAAARWLTDEGMPPQILIGHSLGGAAAIVAAPELPALKALVTIGAPADPSHVLDNFGSSLDAIMRDGQACVELAGRPFEIRRDFVEDVRAASLDDALGKLRAALLVMHAPRDEVVGIDNAAEIFKAARHPKSFITLDDADHLVGNERDAEYAADVISAWSARYLDLAEEPASEDAPEGVVRVAEADAAGFRQDITVNGRHQIVADEPRAMGGSDLGPSPYQLLAAALGACTTMTIRMYARRKKIALTHVTCDVSHQKSHLADGDSGEAKPGKIDVFHRRIRLAGDLDDDTRQSLLAIADKCPVHRTLHEQARIRTELVDEQA